MALVREAPSGRAAVGAGDGRADGVLVEAAAEWLHVLGAFPRFDCPPERNITLG